MQANTASWLLRKILKSKQVLEGVGYIEAALVQMQSFSIQIMYKCATIRDHLGELSCSDWQYTESLLTRDKLAQWGLIDDATCPLCHTTNETVSHPPLECTVSAGLWSRLLRWQGITRSPFNWQNEVDWATRQCKSSSSTTDIYKMTLAGTVYYKWQERNIRIFQHKQRNEDASARDPL
ncbi:uncharacterized protein LOC132608208 [Lycium barbarum]|uniref:uncharacterized protein LOC132608208 n=1 Tax=Lycium barbarum TaxID=112863 RepID=UPI00293E6A74|nr:uncharacterized protein LOC132608208 [Lycium barbarum]